MAPRGDAAYCKSTLALRHRLPSGPEQDTSFTKHRVDIYRSRGGGEREPGYDSLVVKSVA